MTVIVKNELGGKFDTEAENEGREGRATSGCGGESTWSSDSKERRKGSGCAGMKFKIKGKEG